MGEGIVFVSGVVGVLIDEFFVVEIKLNRIRIVCLFCINMD